MDHPSDQLLAGARLAQDEDGGIGRRDHLHLLENPPERRVLPDHPSVGEGEVDLFAEVRVLLLESPSQPVDLAEGPRVDDRDRRVLGDRPEPRELILPDRSPPEDRHDADGFPAEDERLSGEALDTLSPHPLGARQAPGRGIVQQKARTGRSDPTHLERPQRNAAEVAVDTRPVFARGRLRRPGARDQMEAPGLIGTLRSHPAGVAKVPGPQHPHVCQRNVGLPAEALDDTRQHPLLGTLPSDGEGNPL